MDIFIKILVPVMIFCVLLSPARSEAAVQTSLSGSTTELQNQIKTLQAQLQALLNQRLSGSGAVVDLQANGSDNDMSFSGKKKIKLTWETYGTKNCHLYVAQGRSYKVKESGEKTLSIDSSAPYVTVSCNNALTGTEVNDAIHIYDPKGTPELSVSMEDSFTISAVAQIRHPKLICSGEELGTISWGDGQEDLVVAELASGECALVASDKQTHSYTEVGNYKVIFKSSTGTSKKVKIDIGG